MGRLEKQIIIGALALVGVLLTVVVLKGLKPRDGGESNTASLNGWDSTLDNRPGLVVEPGVVKSVDFDGPESASPVQPIFPDVFPPVDPIVPPVGGTSTPAPSQEPWIYTIQGGEVLSKISERELGSVKHMDSILNLNPGMHADQLKEGDSILMPPIASLQSRRPRTTGKRNLAQGAQSHTVVPNDSLWSISMKYYGVDSGIQKIVAANRDLLASKETVLLINWQLVIPQ